MGYVRQFAIGIVLVNFVYGIISMIQLGAFIPLIPLQGVFLSAMAFATWLILPKEQYIHFVVFLIGLFFLLTSPLVYAGVLTTQQVIRFEESMIDILLFVKYLLVGVLYAYFLSQTQANKWWNYSFLLLYALSVVVNQYIPPFLGLSLLILIQLLIARFKTPEKHLFNHQLTPFFIALALLVLMNRMG